MTDFDTIPETALAWHRAGRRAALATVTQTWGSAPRRVGAQLAIAGDFLADQTVYHDSLGAVALVVLTDESGASRVYETRGRMFSRWEGVNLL